MTNTITFAALYKDFTRYQLGMPTQLPAEIPVGGFTVKRSQLYRLASRNYVLQKSFKFGEEPLVFDLAVRLRQTWEANVRKNFNKLSVPTEQTRDVFVHTVPFTDRVIPFYINTKTWNVETVDAAHGEQLKLTTMNKDHVYITFDSDVNRVVRIPDANLGLSELPIKHEDGSVSDHPYKDRLLFEPVLFTNDTFVNKFDETVIELTLYPSLEKSKHFTTPYDLQLVNQDASYKQRVLHVTGNTLPSKDVEPRFFDMVYQGKVVGMVMLVVAAD